MKLIGYEYLKWVQQRLLLVLIPILMIGNGYLYVKDQYVNNDYLIHNMDAYNETEAEYTKMPLGQGYEQIKEVNAELLGFRTMVSAARSPDNPVLVEALNRIKQQESNIQKAFNDSGYLDNLDKLGQDTYISELILKQYETMRSYKQYWNGIKKRADELLMVSIFQDEESFSYRNILKTPKDFASLENIPLQLGREWGIVSATTFQLTDALMVMLHFLLCIYLFQSEKDSGLIKLTRSTAKGRRSLVTAKLATLISMSVFLSLCFYGSVLALGYYLYGFGDLSRYVQAMDSFRYSNLPLTVEHYLSLFLIGKILANMLAALVITVLFIWFGNVFSVYGGLLAFLAIEYFSFRYLHPLSPLHIFKYINLFSFFNVYELLAIYRNLNILGYPVWYPWLALGSSVALLLLLSVLCIAIYTLRLPTVASIRLFDWLPRMLQKLRKPPTSVHLFCHEWHKFMFTGKFYLIVVVAFLIGYQDLNKQEPRFEEEAAIYNRYMRELDGRIDQDKINFVLHEQRRFDELPLQYERIMKQYEEGALTPKQYLEKTEELELFAINKKAFLRVYNQYEHLMELQESRGIIGSFINELSSNYLFQNPFRDVLNGLIYMILLMLSLSVIFPIDYRNGMAAILRSTLRGRFPLFAVKHAIAGIVAMMLLFILYAPAIINTFKNYPSIAWDAPVQSIILYGQLQDSLTVKEFTFGVFGIQLLGAILVSICSLYLSVLMQKRGPALLLASTVFVLPFLVLLAGIEEIQSYTFTGLFTLFDRFAQLDSFLTLGIYMGLLIAISAISCFMAWNRYTNPERGGFMGK